ncbi:hypothetical protein DNTS_001895 [Danionella cerebrum]|uniref:SH3 domain-containing protein n=1 Tax=Danionella cerebrum TaxID=2873325 RepID=A0A553PVW6_9TELE|nr:hypothetical protein DNTS_001895 [Danionella translucida]
MNLFCFSLEGSMDSLYEAVQESSEGRVYSIPSRSHSPACLSQDATSWTNTGRSISMEISQMIPDNNRKQKQGCLPKSVSENDTLDNKAATSSARPADKTQEEFILQRNNHNGDLGRAVRRSESQVTADRKSTPRYIQHEIQSHQIVYYEGCDPTKEAAGIRQEAMTETTNKQTVHPRGPKMKKVEKKSSRRGTPTQEITASTKVRKGLAPEAGLQSHRQEASLAPSSRHRWSNPGDSAWVQTYNTSPAPLGEQHIHSCECSASRNSSQGDPNLTRDVSKRGIHSTTGVDFCASKRSTSFGRFDTFRNQNSPSQLEEHATTEVENESGANHSEKPGSLGKKMKAISMTMRKRIAKKQVKSCSEEVNGSTAEKGSERTSNSLESLYSGQSSSSSGGVVSTSDVSSNRDSLKLEEEVPYSGHFCGRAKVHTDFVPSPYDTDSLKLKVGDVISIISKPPMGIWTGMLNNKVGNFKFIYVDVLPEKEKEEEGEAPKIRPVKVCKKPRPNTLLELLERLNLEEYASSLLLNGYQTVDDLKHLKERHLIELNVADPEHRQRLLAASDCLYVPSKEEDGEMKGTEEEEEDNDCPRDSGCFIPAECSDC